MENQEKSFFEGTQDLAEDYIKNRIWLLRLQTAEKSGRLISLVLTGLVVGLVAFFVLLFLSLMAGFLFARLTGSLFWGFGIVILLYILLLVVLLSIRKKFIDRWITNKVIRVFFDSTDNEDETE